MASPSSFNYKNYFHAEKSLFGVYDYADFDRYTQPCNHCSTLNIEPFCVILVIKKTAVRKTQSLLCERKFRFTGVNTWSPVSGSCGSCQAAFPSGCAVLQPYIMGGSPSSI